MHRRQNLIVETIPLDSAYGTGKAVTLLSKIQTKWSAYSILHSIEGSPDVDISNYAIDDLENGSNKKAVKRSKVEGANGETKTERLNDKTKPIRIFVVVVSCPLSSLSSLAFFAGNSWDC